MLTEQIFDANGVFINYAFNAGSGPPLLLLHGIAERWQTFLPLAHQLTGRWRIYAFDLRGHGESGRVKNRYRVIDYSQDIICFLESQINQPAVILGHSLGALLAIYMAASKPELVKSIILVDPPLHAQHTPLRDIPNGPYEAFKKTVEIIRVNQSVPAIEQAITKLFPGVGAETQRARAEVLSRLDPDALTAFMENQHLADLDLDALLKRIKAPTLLIQGNPELGAALFDKDVERALALLRQGTRLRIPEGGHMLQHSHPEAIAIAVNNFCNQ